MYPPACNLCPLRNASLGLHQGQSALVNYLAWLPELEGSGMGIPPKIPSCTSNGPTESQAGRLCRAPSFAGAPVIPHCPLHGNINISVHKHWSDNPLLFQSSQQPSGGLHTTLPKTPPGIHPGQPEEASFRLHPQPLLTPPVPGLIACLQSTPWLDIPAPLPPPLPTYPV